MPPHLSEQGLDSDPRCWDPFVRARLEGGLLVRDELITTRGAGKKRTYERPPSEFGGVVEPAGTDGARFVAEAGRYVIFVAAVCPWASSVRAARHILGLDDTIHIEIADGQSSAGWVFVRGVDVAPWSERGCAPVYLHEVYTAAAPECTARITMPVAIGSE